MELYIDNQPVELADSSAASVTLSVGAVTDPEHIRAGYTRTLRVRMNAASDAVMGHAGDVHAAEHFNARSHVGRIEHEGAVLIEGPLYFSAAVDDHYEVYIVGGTKEWAVEASRRSLRQTGIAYSKQLTAAAIAASWTDAGAVKFLPVVRRSVQADYSSGSVVPQVRILTADDYHPFVRCAALVEAIFADGGYAVESDFMKSDEFGSLYVSGNYPTRNVSLLKDRMDFLALRDADASAPADHNGRVYANPYLASDTLGNLAGMTADGTFSNGNCLQMDDKRLAFVPTGAVEMGFAYRLRYATDARIKSRTTMTGFDQVYLREQSNVRRFTLANPWPDRRTALRAVGSYRLCVFDHAAGDQYRLTCYKLDAAGAFLGTITYATQAERFAALTFNYPGAAKLSPPTLQYRSAAAAGTWQTYTGDWAIYDGFVTETSVLDVDLNIRSVPEAVTVGAPKFFDGIFFGGAEPGMSMTLKAGTSIRPVFYAQPTEGTTVAFGDVFAHDASQIDFLRAIRQMYDLVFVTDRRRRIVRIEPARAFYIDQNPAMWTSRIDPTKPIRVEELGGDMAQQMTWCYRSGGQLGRWTTRVENAAAANSTKTWENAMLNPSVTVRGLVGGAPSAAVVEAGEDTYESGTDSLNFEPKIVRYEGMKALPAGETWGWPSVAASYPKAAFHAPESGYTLCFEDRDGMTGLHANWDGAVRLWNGSRRVTVWLTLNAADIEQLDFRRLVNLTIDGETALYRLEEVVDFNPKDPSTKCVLIKHIP